MTESSYARPAHELSQQVTDEENAHYDAKLEESKKAQLRRPWVREGSDTPPADAPETESEAGDGKGKLLTTPSRMLKLILPLTRDVDSGVEPLALLVHPQQPLSYLERLIQSELPTITDEKGNEKIPSVTFRAEDPDDKDDGELRARNKRSRKGDNDDAEYIKIDGKLEKTGKLNGHKKDTDGPSGLPAELAGRTFIRWSPSVEVGDFIRDASAGAVFTVTIEGRSPPIVVGVPSFDERTFYLRMRLRKIGRRISTMADVKKDCDKIAQRTAKRMAQAGFAALVGWWYVVYRLTFETDLGWDVMEPVTYLVGLSTLIGGYMWFLWHNREVSYRAAMSLTVSRKQSKLYAERGFDLRRWEALMVEGILLRREIKRIAVEYDSEWDESEEGGEEVKEALRKERKKEKKKEKEEDDKDDKDDKD